VALNLGEQRNLVMVENPGTPVSDGGGGYTLAYAKANPEQWWAAIAKASAHASERVFAATVLAHATHILNGRYHPAITTKTRLTWTDRSGNAHASEVLDVDDVEGRGNELLVLVSEIAQ
jgi:head-tail adaptor